MKTSTQGIEFIKKVEGFKNKAYVCRGGTMTIGYGSTKYLDGQPIKKDDSITQEAAERLLLASLLQYEEAVAKLGTLNQNQFDALVSFAYNLGTNALLNSTLAQQVKLKNFKAAAREFLKWNKAQDPKTKKLIILEGLLTRRLEEMFLFLSI